MISTGGYRDIYWWIYDSLCEKYIGLKNPLDASLKIDRLFQLKIVQMIQKKSSTANFQYMNPTNMATTFKSVMV
jgi:hypothetical protein